MSEDLKEIYVAAIDTFGTQNQWTVAAEEMTELAKEVCKFKRGRGNRKNLIFEMADVLIMVEQLQIIHDIKDEEINTAKRKKTNRLKRRTKNEQSNNHGQTRE